MIAEAPVRSAVRQRPARARRAALVCLALLQCLVATRAAGAQPFGIDVEPPLIEHEPLLETDAGFRQTFFAQIVDDRELASVTLFWRFAGETRYASLAMNQVSTSSTWIARIPTAVSDSRSIEYYIEARDSGGNRTVRGFVFSPLVRRIVNARPAIDDERRGGAVTADTSGTQSATVPAPPMVRSRAIYYVLGALAVGLVVGLVSGGGGNPGPQRRCDEAGCELFITFESPVTQ